MQIIAVLKEADSGMKIQDLRRKHNISNVTFCQWRSKYGGMKVSEVPLLKALVTDLSCDNQTLKLVVSKSVSAPVGVLPDFQATGWFRIINPWREYEEGSFH